MLEDICSLPALFGILFFLAVVAVWVLSLVVACRLLTVVVPLVAEPRACSSHSFQALEHTRASLLHGMWDLPSLGVKLVSLALQDRVLSVDRQGSPWNLILSEFSIQMMEVPCVGVCELSHV